MTTMSSYVKLIAILTSFSIFPSAVLAQSWIIGAGYSDFVEDNPEDSVNLLFEVHSASFYQRGKFELSYGGTVDINETGEYFVGAGLSGVFKLKQNYFLEGSILPGYYYSSDQKNSLGSDFIIRSLLGVGLTLSSGNTISYAITHKSNAASSQFNPGVNSFLLRYRRQF